MATALGTDAQAEAEAVIQTFSVVPGGDGISAFSSADAEFSSSTGSADMPLPPTPLSTVVSSRAREGSPSPSESPSHSDSSSSVPPALPNFRSTSSSSDASCASTDGEECAPPLSLQRLRFQRTRSLNNWTMHHDGDEHEHGEGGDAPHAASTLGALPETPLATPTPAPTPAHGSHESASAPAAAEAEDHFRNQHAEDDEHDEPHHHSPLLRSNDVSVAESADASSLPVADTAAEVTSEEADSDATPVAPVRRIGLSLKIGALESVEQTSSPDIIVSAPEEETADDDVWRGLGAGAVNTSAADFLSPPPHRPRLSLVGLRADGDGDAEESMIETFVSVPGGNGGGGDSSSGGGGFGGGGDTPYDSSASSSLLAYASPMSSMASASPQTPGASIELLQLDSDRCDCLSRQFGLTPQQVQAAFLRKQREMLRRAGLAPP
jgi:hypothetical protein